MWKLAFALFLACSLCPAAALAVTTEETTKFNGYGVTGPPPQETATKLNGYGVTGPTQEMATKFVAYAVVFRYIPSVSITQ